MTTTNSKLIWTEEGYKMFAKEGLKGLRVESLARNLNLNKSLFYDYFDDLDSFFPALMQMHLRIADDYLQELREIKTIDQDFFQLLIKYKTSVLFHMQVSKERNHKTFQNAGDGISKKEYAILEPLWSGYLGIVNKPDLTISYFNIVRDMFYARITFENFDFLFLRNLLTEAKSTIQQVYNREFNLLDTEGSR